MIKATEYRPELKEDLKDIKERLKKLFDVDGTTDALEKRSRNIKARNCYEDIVDEVLDGFLPKLPEYVYELEAYDDNKMGDDALEESAMFKTFEGANENFDNALYEITLPGESLTLLEDKCDEKLGYRSSVYSYKAKDGSTGTKVVCISRRILH